MSRMRFVAALVALGLVASARGEVALGRAASDSSPVVSISLRQGSPWTASGRIDARVLNPLGGLNGDGLPAVAASPSGVLVAWFARSEGEIALAIGRSTWQRVPGVAVEAEPDSPLVTAIPGGWIVAWSVPASGEVRAAVVSATGAVSDLGAVVEGTARGLVVGDDVGHLLTSSSVAGLVDVVFSLPTPEPSPIIWRTRAVVTLAQSIAPAAGSAELLIVANPGVAPVVYFAAAVGAPVNDFESGDMSVVWHGGERGRLEAGRTDAAVLLLPGSTSSTPALALWWRDASTLEFATLFDDRVGVVRRVTGRGAYSPSLVHEALRLARSE